MSDPVDYIASGFNPNDGLGDGHWATDRNGIQRWVGTVAPQPPGRKCPTCQHATIGPRAAACRPCRVKRNRGAA